MCVRVRLSNFQLAGEQLEIYMYLARNQFNFGHKSGDSVLCFISFLKIVSVERSAAAMIIVNSLIMLILLNVISNSRRPSIIFTRFDLCDSDI